MTDKPNNERSERPQPAPAYEKPAIAWEEVLEIRKTLAVACGKTAGKGGFCNAVPTS